MVEELKPCPFCQSKVEAVSGNNLRTGRQIDSGFMFECENLHTFEIPYTKEVNSWEAAFSVFNHTPSAPLPEEVDAAIDGMTDVLAEAVSQTPCENVNEVKRRFNKNMDVIRANMRHQAAEIERLKANQRSEIRDEVVKEAYHCINASVSAVWCFRLKFKKHPWAVLKQALSERDALKARVEELEEALRDIVKVSETGRSIEAFDIMAHAAKQALKKGDKHGQS